jgi:hypothetical protein
MTTAEHFKLHDKQIAAIRGLVQEGMKLVVAHRKDMRIMQKDLADLIAALKRSTNGKG